MPTVIHLCGSIKIAFQFSGLFFFLKSGLKTFKVQHAWVYISRSIFSVKKWEKTAQVSLLPSSMPPGLFFTSIFSCSCWNQSAVVLLVNWYSWKYCWRSLMYTRMVRSRLGQSFYHCLLFLKKVDSTTCWRQKNLTSLKPTRYFFQIWKESRLPMKLYLLRFRFLS